MIGLSEINALRRAGLISGRRYLDAVYRVRNHEYWATWVLRAVLALGAGHFLAGIIFFFAHNWADMTAATKFGVVETGIVVAAIGALVMGVDRLLGQTLLIAASVLVGVLLAVIGQVYQTGADAYELFAAWSLLILPWVMASRNAAHWLVWLVVVYLATTFYHVQVLAPLAQITSVEFAVLLGTALIVALAAREVAGRAGVAWMAAIWTRSLLVFVALGHFFIPAVGYVLDINDEPLGVFAFLLVLCAGAAIYRWPLREFAAFSLVIGYAGFFLMAVGGRLLDEAIGFDWDETARLLSSLVLLVAWCVIVTGSMGKLLLRGRQRFAKES